MKFEPAHIFDQQIEGVVHGASVGGKIESSITNNEQVQD